MSEDDRPAPKAPPHWTEARTADQGPFLAGPEPRPGDTALTRFLGGQPGSVFLRLLFVSLIVGAFLMWLDIRPLDILRGVKQLIDRIWGLGFDAIREIANFILAGAAIVIPVWLVLRLMTMRNAR
ncbi:MAG: endo alpha-1,4 polygalactosaminidase [Beijerinckiaceae bacterium]|nr:endo alpha-1,4 polygalactosaminidase [Beijerinckiaceae bacterium]